MKQIALPLLLLIIVLFFTVFNGIYTANCLDSIIQKVKELPEIPEDDTKDILYEIESEWESKKELFSSVIKYDFIFNFTKELSSAKAGCTADDDGTYLSSKKTMQSLLEYMRDIQKFRPDNIV